MPTLLTALVGSVLAVSVNAQSVPGATYFDGNGQPGAGHYILIDNYPAEQFFDKFNFYSSYDPTYGHVQYVNESIAVQNGLVSISNNQAVIKPDTTNVYPRGGPGRPSVRITSDNTYTHGLFILDVAHMPWGCGTWPAYWLLGPNWPYTGEIDIIEGVHNSEQNSISLHTSPGCMITGSNQVATFENSNCDTSVNGNSGCGSALMPADIPNNYGDGLNSIGGGVYATEWTTEYIQHWFFPRGSIPSNIAAGQPDPSTWGEPDVNQQGPDCQIDDHFTNMSIIINTDFCGAWAGNVYSQYNCPASSTATNSLDSCVDYVGNNPQAMTDAFWEINSIQVYQLPANAVAESSYTTSLSSTTPAAESTNTIPKGVGTSTDTVSSAPYSGPVSSGTSTLMPTATATPVAICPSYNETTYTDSQQNDYTISCGSDYNAQAGSFSGAYNVDSFDACLVLCDGIDGCKGVGFVGGNGAGTCYPKASVPPGGDPFYYDGSTNAGVRKAGSGSGAANSKRTLSGTGSLIGPNTGVQPSASDSFITSTLTSATVSGSVISSPTLHVVSSSFSSFIQIPSTSITSNTHVSSPSSSTTSSQTSSSESSNIALTSSQHTGFSATTTRTESNVKSSIALSSSVVNTINNSGLDSSSSDSLVTAGMLSLSTISSNSLKPSASSCPIGSIAYCNALDKEDLCPVTIGYVWDFTCNVEYLGVPVFNASSLTKRSTELTLSGCEKACRDLGGCSAFNYQGLNCTLLTSIEGKGQHEGGVGARLVSSPSQSLSSSATNASTSRLAIASATETMTIPLSSGATITVMSTTTVTATSGRSFASGPSGSYYVYSSSPGPVSSSPQQVSASLCYTCNLTPTVLTTSPRSPSTSWPVAGEPLSTPTCKARPGTGTTTIKATRTVTGCPSALTCPASGFYWATDGGRGRVITTTNNKGQPITYTELSSGVSDLEVSGQTSSRYGEDLSEFGSATTTTSSRHSSTTVTGTNGAPKCPYSDKSVFTDSMGMLYLIECGLTLTDPTLETETRRSLVDCMSACDMYNVVHFPRGSPCLGVSFDSSSDSRNCLLKAGFTSLVDPSIDSARLLSPNTNAGGSYGSVSRASEIATMVPTSTWIPSYVLGGTTRTTVNEPVTLTGVSGGVTRTSVVAAPTVTFVSGGTTYTAISDGSTITGITGGITLTTIDSGSTIFSVSDGQTYTSVNGGNLGTADSSGKGGSPETTVAVISTIGNTQTFEGSGSTNLVPMTIYGTSAAVSTYISGTVSYLTTYGITTVISVSYLPASTETVTTTTVSLSISERLSTVAGPTVTQSGNVVTLTLGGSQFLTITQVVTQTVFPSASSSSFTCRTYATNYVNGASTHRRNARRSIFDFGGKQGMMGYAPQPGAIPRPGNVLEA